MPKFKFNKNALGDIITEDKVTEDTETVGKSYFYRIQGIPISHGFNSHSFPIRQFS